MQLKLIGQGNWPNTSTVEVVDDDSLKIDGELYEFPPDVVEFDPAGQVLAASRHDGQLWVTVLVRYGPGESAVWTTRDSEGRLRGELFEAHGPGVVAWS